MTKRSRKKGKSISKRTRHPNSLDKVTPLLSGEVNKLIKVAIFIFLAVATFTIYSNVQNHEFLIYDDYKYIKNNLKIKSGLSSENISWALTTFYGNNWFPVTWLSHMLDYQLYGLNPKGHHLANLGFHIANVLILFIVLLRMTRKLWRCAFVVALFAPHPLNEESVHG